MSVAEQSDPFLSAGSDQRFLYDTGSETLELMIRSGAERERIPDSLADWLVVICHPHPLHGGSMDNKVVTTLARAAREEGLDSLRFNFRGVGRSSGQYGEFLGECDDFDKIMQWVRVNTGKRRFIVAGFSFGSAVAAARVGSVEGCEQLLLVAPPVSGYEYPQCFDMPVAVIQGSEDEVVNAAEVTDWVNSLSSPCEYYYANQTSHFFHGKLLELRHKAAGIFSFAARD